MQAGLCRVLVRLQMSANPASCAWLVSKDGGIRRRWRAGSVRAVRQMRSGARADLAMGAADRCTRNALVDLASAMSGVCNRASGRVRFSVRVIPFDKISRRGTRKRRKRSRASKHHSPA